MGHRFYEQGEGEDKEYWFEREDVGIRLSEDNYIMNLHREDSLYDRACVEDPRDQDWWQYWRYDVGDEMFDQLVFVAQEIGSLMIRDTVLDNVRQRFEEAHQLDDSDYNELLKGAA